MFVALEDRPQCPHERKPASPRGQRRKHPRGTQRKKKMMMVFVAKCVCTASVIRLSVASVTGTCAHRVCRCMAVLWVPILIVCRYIEVYYGICIQCPRSAQTLLCSVLFDDPTGEEIGTQHPCCACVVSQSRACICVCMGPWGHHLAFGIVASCVYVRRRFMQSAITTLWRCRRKRGCR